MPITMDARLMSALMDLAYQICVFFDGLADQEKCGLSVMLCQRFEHSRRIAWMRAIIEGQGDLGTCFIAMPENLRVFSLHRTIISSQANCDQVHIQSGRFTQISSILPPWVHMVHPG